jgi:hypothetical protein
MGLKEPFLDERIICNPEVQHPPLPFFHCCEAMYLQPILAAGQLEPMYCNVYDEKLLYLFYGRPAYKSSQSLNSRFNFMMPVCFIVSNDALTAIKRLVAFDSGAFDHYSDCLHPSMKREEFHLTPTKETLNKMVHFFFNGNDPYFEGRPRDVIEYDAAHFPVESYHSIISGRSKMALDDRKASFEAQVDFPIEINKNNIEAIILPKALSLSPIIKAAINRLEIEMIPITNYGVVATDYYVHILDITREFLVKRKKMNGH